MNIDVKGTDLERLLEGAVMQALGDVGREVLIKEVVRYLTTKTGGGYGASGTSPLMQALQMAADAAAKRYIADKMTNDPDFLSAIDSLYVDAFKRFNSADTREKLVEKMSYRLSEAFSKDY